MRIVRTLSLMGISVIAGMFVGNSFIDAHRPKDPGMRIDPRIPTTKDRGHDVIKVPPIREQEVPTEPEEPDSDGNPDDAKIGTYEYNVSEPISKMDRSLDDYSDGKIELSQACGDFADAMISLRYRNDKDAPLEFVEGAISEVEARLADLGICEGVISSSYKVDSLGIINHQLDVLRKTLVDKQNEDN